MIESEFRKLESEGRIYWGLDNNSQPNVIRYLSEVEGLVPWTWWPHEEVGHTDEAKKEILDLFPDEGSFPTPKPVRLLDRILQVATNPEDLILDSFAGSGTTAHAAIKLNAEDGGNRRFILVEMDPAIARPITAERVRRVAEGYTNAKGEQIEGLGGGFRFCALGSPLFDGEGQLNGELTREALAHHLYFTEFGEPLPHAMPAEGSFIGAFGDRALHLFFQPGGAALFDRAALQALPPFAGERVVFADGCAVPAQTLAEAGVRFRQIPYDVRG